MFLFSFLPLFILLHVHKTYSLPDGEIPPSTRSGSRPESSKGEFCETNGLYFRQLLAGVDFAKSKNAKTVFQKQSFQFAKQMQNYVYLIGDRETQNAVVIDGCWDPIGINRIARLDGMKINGYVATHFHWDHVGGKVDYEPFKSMNVDLPGLKDFVMGSKRNREKKGGKPVRKAWINQLELKQTSKRTGVPESSLTPLIDRSVVDIGNRLRLTFRHTPGHSRGSMIILVSDRNDNDNKPLFMISGDTLFPGSCGRVDLPESNAERMYDSLMVVASFDDDLVVFPGHAYSGANTTIRKEKKSGLLGISRSQWMQGR